MLRSTARIAEYHSVVCVLALGNSEGDEYFARI